MSQAQHVISNHWKSIEWRISMQSAACPKYLLKTRALLQLVLSNFDSVVMTALFRIRRRKCREKALAATCMECGQYRPPIHIYGCVMKRTVDWELLITVSTIRRRPWLNSRLMMPASPETKRTFGMGTEAREYKREGTVALLRKTITLSARLREICCIIVPSD